MKQKQNKKSPYFFKKNQNNKKYNKIFTLPLETDFKKTRTKRREKEKEQARKS